jgi:hypothetical protein
MDSTLTSSHQQEIIEGDKIIGGKIKLFLNE